MRRSKRKSQQNKYFLSLAIGIALVFLIVSSSPVAQRRTIIPEKEFHVHADFKVFINGHEIDFSLPRYNIRNRYIHLHTDNDFGGNVIHIEGRNATMGEFFLSLAMNFNSTCFATPEEFCNSEARTLKFYISGKRNELYEMYEPADLDRILISYGNETEEMIQQQADSITKLACVFSNKCPVPGDVRVVTL